MINPRLIANKGQLFDVEFHDIVKTVIAVAPAEIAEFAWYIQPIDNDQRVGSIIEIQHREEDSEETTFIAVPIIMSINGIDGKFLWRAGIDLDNQVVGIRYRRRGT